MMKNPPSLQVNLDALPEPPEQVFVAVDEGTPDPSWVYGSDLSKIRHVDVLTGTKCWQFATRFGYDDIEVRAIEPELGAGAQDGSSRCRSRRRAARCSSSTTSR